VDEELRTYLTAMEGRLKSHVDERVENSLRAMAAEIGALHTDIRQVETRLTARMDEYHNRLDRHGALLQTGARQIVRIFEGEEELSRLWRDLEKRTASLEIGFRNGSGETRA
jgi:hypothetical protein